MKTTYKNLVIIGKLKELGKNQSEIWGGNGSVNKIPLKSNVFDIHVKNIDTKEFFSFKVHSSHNDWSNKVIELDEDGLLGAFYSLLLDCLSGCESFEDFKGSFGDDASLKVFRACEHAYNKFERVINEDVYDYLMNFQEVNKHVI